MILLDTGYLIALLDANDSLHERAVGWSEAITESTVVTDYVLLEAFNYFSRPPVRQRVHTMLEMLRADVDCEIVAAAPDLLAGGLTLHRSRPDKAWSLTDCISFHLMSQRGITRALAQDEHFRQAGFDALLRRDPR